MRIHWGVIGAGILWCAAVGAQEAPPGFQALGRHVPGYADRVEIPKGWKDVTPAAAAMPALTDAERAAGYVLFSRNPMGEPQVCDAPFRFEIDRPIITFAALAQYEPILLCVRPLEDLEDAVLTVSDLVGPGGKLLGAQNVDVRQLWIQRRAADRAAKTYRLVPDILEAAHPTAMTKGLTRHYWVTLFAPKDAVPGVYRGTATFRAKGRPSATREIALRVLPFELDPPGISYGVFYALYRDWLKAFGEGDVIPGQRMKHLVDQREHGMNCLTVSSPMRLALRGTGEDVEPVFDASQPGEGVLATFVSLDEELNSAREAGFDRTRCVWFGDADFAELSRELLQLRNQQDPKPFDADRAQPGTWLFDRVYDAALGAGVGRFREAQLTEPYICVLGRPSDTEELSRACGRYLAMARKLDDLTFLFVNGGSHGEDQSGRFRGKLDVACHKDILGPQVLDEDKAAGVQQVWICGAASFTDAHFNRMRFGWYLLRIGAAGALEWAYQWPGPGGMYDDLFTGESSQTGASRPGDGTPAPFDAPGAHESFAYPSPDGPLPTVAWEGFRAAVDDVRYVRTLERLCREKQGAKPEDVAVARQELADMVARFSINERDTVTVVSPDTAQIWRGRLAWHILKLMDVAR
ncbi:MAG: hypothetical protein ABSA67_05755 [Candidatus Brocadiia bacterium]|jgi:hypothetical protein